MRTSASLKWFVTRRQLVAQLSRSTITTKHFDHYSASTLQSDPSVSAAWTAPCTTRIVSARKIETRRLEKRYRYTKADDDDKLWRVTFKH
jgi:hypothetical protein